MRTDYELAGQSLICFAGEDWWYHHPHEKSHYFTRLAKNNKILFINSLTLGLPAIQNPDFFLKIKRKLKSQLRWLRSVPEGFWVMTPIAIPVFDSRLLTLLNRWLLKVQIKLASMICGLDRTPILWVHIPTAVDIAEHLSSKLIVYQITDKLDANEDSALRPNLIRSFDRRLKRLADVVLYNSRRLFEESDAPHRVLIPMGVDYDHFAHHVEPAADTVNISGPVLGYFGTMDYVMDTYLIKEVLARRPEWQWVMIGTKTNVVDLAAPNLHFLGSRPYEELPKYISRFDVCILPWHTDHPFTVYGSAIKVREYLASGKPVVMAPLYEYLDTPGIRFFHDADEFIDAVEDALANDTEADRELRRSQVRNTTWDHRTAQLGRLLAAKLRGRPVPGDIEQPKLASVKQEIAAG